MRRPNLVGRFLHQISSEQRRARRALLSCLTVASLLPMLLAACSTASASTPLAKNQVFVWPYTGANKVAYDEVLDPAAISLLQDIGTISMLYTNLVTLDSSLRVQADAATKWDVDPTGTVYTFHLRPNMKFNDGTPLTAASFAYGIDRALNAKLCSVLDDKTYGQDGTQSCPEPPIASNYLDYIIGADARANGSGPSLISTNDDPQKGLNVLDPLTLRIRLVKPVAYFLQALTYPTSSAMEQSFVEDPQYAGGTWVDHLDKAGTSGPFKIKSYNNGKQLSLVPNPYWADAWNQKLKLTEVDRPMYTSADDEYNAYRSGVLDLTEVPPQVYNSARGQSDFVEIPTLSTRYFGMNVLKPPFDNQQVRVAFDLALNKQLLVGRIESGSALPTNHIIPAGMPGYSPTLQTPAPDRTHSITGNQAAAQSLLQQAQADCEKGTSSAPDSCPYITGASPKEIDVWTDGDRQTNKDLVTAAVQMWRSALTYTVNSQSVALNVQPKFTDTFGSLASKIYARDPNDATKPANPFQIWQIGWIADYADPQDFLSLQFKTGVPDNAVGYSDPTTDAAFQQADEEQNPIKRIAEYNALEQKMIDLSLWIPYEQDKYLWRQRLWVHGFTMNASENSPDISWPNVYITAH